MTVILFTIRANVKLFMRFQFKINLFNENAKIERLNFIKHDLNQQTNCFLSLILIGNLSIPLAFKTMIVIKVNSNIF